MRIKCYHINIENFRIHFVMREMRGYDHRNHSYSQSHSNSSHAGGYEDRRASTGGYEDRRSGGGGGARGGFEVRREPGYEERRGGSRSERQVSQTELELVLH